MKTCISASQRHGCNRHAAFFISCCNTVFCKRPPFRGQKTAFYNAKDGLLHGERPSFTFQAITDYL